MQDIFLKFLNAQDAAYHLALQEIRGGHKRSHWMWFVFPQLAGLGSSDMARKYAISSLAEATPYLAHPILGKRLEEITTALLVQQNRSAYEVFGSPDDMKLRSSMTLFSQVNHAPPVFQHVLDTYFNGLPDQRTLDLLGKG